MSEFFTLGVHRYHNVQTQTMPIWNFMHEGCLQSKYIQYFSLVIVAFLIHPSTLHAASFLKASQASLISH